MKPLKILALSGLMTTTALFTACNGARRVDVMYDTKAELEDGRVLPAVLLEFSDQAPELLLQELPNAPVIRDSNKRFTVILGAIRNQTRSSTSDFEIVNSRIRNRLISSPARERLMFVEKRARMDRIGVEENITGVSGGNTSGPDNYDGATTLLMNLDVNEVARGDTIMYYMNVTLSHYTTNEIVFSDEYIVKVDTD